jgi:two-component system CheB/CheR fusion protein
VAAPSPSVRICGIGASAGGVEALQQLFSALPADLGLAYVVVLHLAPDRKSELDFLLGRWTTMPVTQVVDHDTVKLLPDHVYVIAPDRQLEISDSSVTARHFEEPRGHRAAIDIFFRSLAAAHGDGFAVILSGSGSDGALGARAIKARGGLVLVQDPAEAGHGSMPRSVIATGAADLVLPIGELAVQLAELARSKDRVEALLRAEEDPPVIDEDEDRALRSVLEVLHKTTGHDFSKYKRATIYRRLARRMQLVQQFTIPAYLTYLRSHTPEQSALFDDLLITVTTFFRDPAAWTAFREHVVAPLVETSEPGEPIRVWVAGCATGEEAYSVAMLFEEEFERRGASRNLLIFASDVDERALAVAREGVYPQAIAADVSEARLQRFFRAEDSHYRIVRELRDRVVFASHSVLRDPPFSRMHVITCRNLLIYFDRDLQEQVMSVFRYACRDRGRLFLGASESADEELFRPVDKRHRIFAVRPITNGARPTLPELGGSAGIRESSMPRRPQPHPPPTEAHVSALEELAPPTVLLDERGNVLHLSASASHFLRQGGGPLARRITELIRPELRDEAHTLLHWTPEGATARLTPFVPVRFDESTRRVALLCHRRVRQDRVELLITFLDAGEIEPGAAAGEPPADESMRELREKLRQAEHRIEELRDEHYLTFEELRATNEELQSLNEEYRSTTEELETSKEELQSVNEELQTVNHELQLKLEELSRGHSDLINLMAATNIATLFLSPSLRIKRYTPQLESLFNIRGRDLDRPIGDLTHGLDYPDLIANAQQVLLDGVIIEREVDSHDGRTFAVRLGPYRSETSAIDGVVVTLIDVSRLKQVESALRDSERRLETDLDVLRRLHEMTLQVATALTLHSALERIVEAAVELHGADGGAMQLLDKASGQLELTAQCGSRPPGIWADPSGRGSETSDEALRTRSIVQVSAPPGRDHSATRPAGPDSDQRSLQATPLVSRSGELAGVLTVWFDECHVFHERDTQLGDVLGRLAGELVESRTQQMATSASQAAATEIRLLLRRLVNVQEEERRRVARDIHDHVGQQMTALRLDLSALRLALETDARVLPQVARIEARASELDSSIENVTKELRPSTLDHLGLPVALRDLVNESTASSGIYGDVEVLPESHVPSLPMDTSLNLYRIAQEALHNVQRHAQAKAVHLVLDIRPREIRMVIEDDGQGFEQSDVSPNSAGLGLVTMRERALSIGGSLEIESAPGAGVTILVRAPRGEVPEA